MHINDAFPSTYLKCTDLKGKEVNLIIDGLKMEDVGDDHKPVLSFKGTDKRLVLNKTNAMRIADTYGPVLTKWVGLPITVYPDRVDFQGKRVDAIRIRVDNNLAMPAAAPVPAAPPKAAAVEPAHPQYIPDEEIPF